MNCACEERDGHVVNTCGAHAEYMRNETARENERLRAQAAARAIPMLIWCPGCGERHIDEGEFAQKLHHTHACQHCGHVFRVAIECTVGVRFLPGFKNETVVPDVRVRPPWPTCELPTCDKPVSPSHSLCYEHQNIADGRCGECGTPEPGHIQICSRVQVRP